MKPIKKSLGERGISLVEMLIVVGILAFVSLAIGSTFGEIFKWQAQVVSRDESNEFSASVARFLYTDSTCTSALTGQLFPINGTSDVRLPGYIGFAAQVSQSGSKEVASALVKGMQLDPRLRIRELSISDKGMPAQPLMANGVRLNRYLAEIRLGMEAQDQGRWSPVKDRTFSFPVLVDPNTRQIRRCYLEMMVDDACAVLGSSLDPATGKCVPLSQCLFEGHFTVNTCSPATGSCPHGFLNDITHAASCPSGLSTRKETGAYDWTYSESCGKKCTSNITVNTRYYVCLKCN